MLIDSKKQNELRSSTIFQSYNKAKIYDKTFQFYMKHGLYVYEYRTLHLAVCVLCGGLSEGHRTAFILFCQQINI